MSKLLELEKVKSRSLKASFDPKTFNETDNTVEVVFATETDKGLRITESGKRYYEVLECTRNAVMLERLNAGAPVLNNHKDDDLDNQIGVVVKAWVDDTNKECRAIVKLSADEALKSIVGRIKEGVIRNISMEYNTYEGEVIGDKDGIPVVKIRNWEPTEISFVLKPFDIGAGVRSSNKDNDLKISNIKNNTMLTEQQKLQRQTEIRNVVSTLGLDDDFANTLIDDEAVTVDVARVKAIEEVGKRKVAAQQNIDVDDLTGKERKRALDILSICETLGLGEVRNDQGKLFSHELIGDVKVDLNEARKRAIDKAATMDNNSKPFGGHSAGVMNNERAKKRAISMEDAIMERVGLQRKDETGKIIPLEPGMYRNMSLKEIGFASLQERNMNPYTMSEEQLKAEIFGAPGSQTSQLRMGGNLSTSDFPAIMENVLNKIARRPYELATRTWEPFVKRTTAKDFKPMSRPVLNDIYIDEVKDKVKEGGEYTRAKMTDNTEKYSVEKWGKIVGFTWEALINDDLSQFDRTVTSLVGGWAQAQNRMIYSVLTSTSALANNANVMYDGNVLFHTSHKNLIASGAVIDITALNAARVKLMTQKAPNGNLLNLMGRFLVVGPNNIQTAEQYTSVNFTPNQAGLINKYGPTLTPIVDANITGNDWYLIVAPNDLEGIEVATLNGNEVYTESKYSFAVDGYEVKARFTFGYKVLDWRFAVKNPGA